MKTSSPVRIVGASGYTNDITEDGELYVAQTPQEHDVWSQFTKSFSATEYFIIVSLTHPQFPHIRQGQKGGRIEMLGK